MNIHTIVNEYTITASPGFHIGTHYNEPRLVPCINIKYGHLAYNSIIKI